MSQRLWKAHLPKLFLWILGALFLNGIARAETGQPAIAVQQTEVLKLILGLDSLEGLILQQNPTPRATTSEVSVKVVTINTNTAMLAAILGVESLDGLHVMNAAGIAAVPAAQQPNNEKMLAAILGVNSLSDLNAAPQMEADKMPKSIAQDQLLALILGVDSLGSVRAADAGQTRPSPTQRAKDELLAAILGVKSLADVKTSTEIADSGGAIEGNAYGHEFATLLLGSGLEGHSSGGMPKVELILSAI